ncbi:hypothetical protein BB558_007214 [Smittium angustum]|uniref:Tc1-like transposase DDE domain-containing protein n=1 Tax=Smittium angustum TaxID=133377 RepID=A0A2U1IVM7_SMIAN|nr:hypothetical protein BB558_007214 [Smittium angustum]
MDKSNVNLYLRRTKGRSPRGERSISRIPNTSGICSHAWSFEGHHITETCFDWCRGLIVLHMSPYLPMLNPIENAWSDTKSFIKRKMAFEHNQFMLGDPNGVLSQSKFGLIYVETLIEQSQQVITVEKSNRFIENAKTFYERVINNEDMPFGN